MANVSRTLRTMSAGGGGKAKQRRLVSLVGDGGGFQHRAAHARGACCCPAGEHHTCMALSAWHKLLLRYSSSRLDNLTVNIHRRAKPHSQIDCVARARIHISVVCRCTIRSSRACHMHARIVGVGDDVSDAHL